MTAPALSAFSSGTARLSRAQFLGVHPDALSPSEIVRLLGGGAPSAKRASMPMVDSASELSDKTRSRIEAELRSGLRFPFNRADGFTREALGMAEHYRFSRICRAWLTAEGRDAARSLQQAAEAAAERDRMRIVREGSRIVRRTETVVDPGWGLAKTACFLAAALAVMVLF